MDEAAAAILALLAARGEGQTICPSEAARSLAGQSPDWRARMDEVHAAVDALLHGGAIRLSWRGIPKSERRGPYRIARRHDLP
ncbi:MAG: DUF3253 domain-containing protein [Erythrobacter sp.]